MPYSPDCVQCSILKTYLEEVSRERQLLLYALCVYLFSLSWHNTTDHGMYPLLQQQDACP